MDAIFQPAHILLPQDCDQTKWSVVACDQYTSQPEYWAEVERQVGDAPSTLRLILPELFLEKPDVQERIVAIHQAGRRYLQQGVLRELPQKGFIYLKRTLANGQIRRGLVGKLDLLAYDYAPGSRPLVRATEGTVVERIPPRMKVRQGAAVESPHIMLLADDPHDQLMGPLEAEPLKVLYDFALMQGSGAVQGRLVAADACKRLVCRLRDFAAGREMVFAVGDGNHSLATAKACYMQLRQEMDETAWKNHPARYALVEVVNLHDPSLQFEAIHRVLFDVDPAQVLEALRTCALQSGPGRGSLATMDGSGRREWTLQGKPGQLPVGVLQRFLDDYIAQHGGRLDYIHGEEVACRLGKAPRSIAFLLPQMEKAALFPAVTAGGPLPRKTFSMGEARDKRFYLECRRIV